MLGAPFLQGMEFREDGVVISYATTEDVRYNGALAASHQLMIAAHPDYLHAIDDIRDAVIKLLKEALIDFAESSAFVVEEPEDDEDKGMGDG
jgi:hypothetical protein